MLPPPHFSGLPAATRAAAGFVERATAVRGARFVNAEGGDVSHGSARLLARHTANYLAAAEIAEAASVRGPVVDVGAGTGAHSAWLAERLGEPVTVVDHAEPLRGVAQEAFPGLGVAADLDQVEPRSAGLVTAMEVLEHIGPTAQPGFLAAVWERVAPGGLLVLSTPDESGYVGGWSGYAPHVGCVDAAALTMLLRTATGRTPSVWRLEGRPFRLTPVSRVLEPVANRVWTAVGPTVRPLWGRLQERLPERSRGAADPAGLGRVWAVPPGQGTGTGLLAAVLRD